MRNLIATRGRDFHQGQRKMDDAKARFHIQRNLGFAAWLISDLLSYFWSSLLLRRQGLVSSPSSSRWTGTNIAHSLLLCIVSLATQASGSHCQECPVRRQRHHPQFTVVVAAAGRGHSSKRARRKWIWMCAGLEVSPLAPVSNPGPHPAFGCMATETEYSRGKARCN